MQQEKQNLNGCLQRVRTRRHVHVDSLPMAAFGWMVTSVQDKILVDIIFLLTELIIWNKQWMNIVIWCFPRTRLLGILTKSETVVIYLWLNTAGSSRRVRPRCCRPAEWGDNIHSKTSKAEWVKKPFTLQPWLRVRKKNLKKSLVNDLVVSTLQMSVVIYGGIPVQFCVLQCPVYIILVGKIFLYLNVEGR